MIKKVLLVLAGLALLILAGIMVAFRATSGLTAVADDFFAEVAAGDLQQAREFLSEEFRTATSADDLKLFLEKSSLGEFQSASWHNRTVTNDSGLLQGEVTTKTGGTIPLTMKFVKEAGDWRIYAMQKPSAGITQSDIDQAPLPSREEAAAMVQQTTSDFAAAINSNDFSALHAKTAPEFQEQIPLDKFAATFAAFIEQKIDLTPLEKLEPLFTTDPAVSAHGQLQLEGYYPSQPSRAFFSYRYLWRDEQWQILGINMNLKASQAPEAETQPEEDTE